MGKKLIAEFLGTFCLVFAGTGAIVIDSVSGGAVSHVGVALTFGLIVLAMIYTIGDISGAHINPAVTIGFFAARRFKAGNVIPYVACQCGGALVASVVLRFLFPQSATLGATVPAGSAMQSFVLEMILTTLLMFVILSVSTGAREKGITAGIAVGAVIALEALSALQMWRVDESCAVVRSRSGARRFFSLLGVRCRSFAGRLDRGRDRVRAAGSR